MALNSLYLVIETIHLTVDTNVFEKIMAVVGQELLKWLSTNNECVR